MQPLGKAEERQSQGGERLGPDAYSEHDAQCDDVQGCKHGLRGGDRATSEALQASKDVHEAGWVDQGA